MLANFPFEGLPTLKKFTVKRVVQTVMNSKGQPAIRKSTVAELSGDGLVVVGENDDLDQTYNAIQKALSKRMKQKGIKST